MMISDNMCLFSLIERYAAAQSALERMEERYRLSPVRQAWKVRIQIAERQALARIDGQSLDPSEVLVDGRGSISTGQYDLTHWSNAIAKRITLNEISENPDALLDWLGVGSLLHNISNIHSAVVAWQSRIASLPPSPPLLQSSQLAACWWDIAPIGRGDIIAGLLIGDRWGPGRWNGSMGGLVAMGLESSQASWRTTKGPAFETIWVAAIQTAAQIHLDLELRLRNFAARVDAAIQAKRRPGKLRELMVLAMSRPRLNSAMVSRILDLTHAGSIKIIANAVESGLLIEQTGQSTYRSYAIPVAMS